MIQNLDSHLIVPKPYVIQIDQTLIREHNITAPGRHDSPSQIIMFTEMAQQCDLSQGPPCQYHLVKHPRNALYGYRFSTQRILNRDDETVGALTQRTDQFPPRWQVK